mgnify:CR=1 FL=1
MEYQIERRRYMSNIACEMLPGGGFIMRRAEECSEADRAKNFYCIHCRVRVYLHLPMDKRKIRRYFAAGDEPHKEGCPAYKERLFQTVSHLDHTGDGVDLEELMRGFRQVCRHHPGGDKGTDDGLTVRPKDDPEEEPDLPIQPRARKPSTLVQFYVILKDPISTKYSGYDVHELIVDKSTINYHRNHTLDHTALVVCKRCTPPQKIKGRLADEGIYPRSLTFRAPYAAPQKQKDIYYVLVCNTRDDRNTILNAITKDSAKGGENKPDDKYLAMAAWSPYIETDKICAYIGHLPSTGCFHRLPPRYDCDQE